MCLCSHNGLRFQEPILVHSILHQGLVVEWDRVHLAIEDEGFHETTSQRVQVPEEYRRAAVTKRQVGQYAVQQLLGSVLHRLNVKILFVKKIVLLQKILIFRKNMETKKETMQEKNIDIKVKS